MTTEAAVAKFKLSAFPLIGIETVVAPRTFSTSFGKPRASFPKTQIEGFPNADLAALWRISSPSALVVKIEAFIDSEKDLISEVETSSTTLI